MYRNCVYTQKGGEGVISLFTWDEEGNRQKLDSTFFPYYYVECKNADSYDGISLYNTKVRRLNFQTDYERRQSLNNPVDLKIYENLRAEHQFLIDTYWDKKDSEDFTKFPLKVWYIDIEVYSPDEFPHADKAAHPINAITAYDSLTQTYHIWGVGEYHTTRTDVIYRNCKSERELLLSFLNLYMMDYPDVLSGWNSEFFDIPYIINRITNMFGEELAQRLSPLGKIRCRAVPGKYGREQIKWHVEGVSCLDYLEVYRVFSPGEKESFKLDYIAELELGERKVSLGTETLWSLADNDWQKFIDYNLQDVMLLVKLDEKLMYLKLLRVLAYVGLTTLENAMGTLSTVTGAAVIEGRKQGLIIPTFLKDEMRNTKYEGAYVSDPQRGFQKNIVSFDANSLYPSCMISLNLSPETKIGTIFDRTATHVYIRHVNGKEFKLSHVNFKKFLVDEKVSVSKADKLFSQKKKGIFPTITDNFYDIRKKHKKEWDKARLDLVPLEEQLKADPKNTELQEKHKKLKFKIEQLWIHQFTYKILINRIYGYFGNKHSPMGDGDIARSITLTGQGVIKKSNDLIKEFVKLQTGLTDDDLQKKNPVLYNDTDSVYASLTQIIEHKSISLLDKRGEVTKEVHALAKECEIFLNKGIDEWARNDLNSTDPRLVFKRESICDAGFFLMKKRYILHKLDDEGVKCNKFKYTGVEVVRTTMPKPVKPLMKAWIEHMVLKQDYKSTNDIFLKLYDTFCKMEPEQVAFTSSIKNYEAYASKCQGFKTAKGMPLHVKSAHYYNLLLDNMKINSKYEPITSGDKIKFFYVEKPNKFGIATVAYKTILPEEFKSVLRCDKELMFEKIISSVVERMYDAVNWKFFPPGSQVKTDLFALLGVPVQENKPKEKNVEEEQEYQAFIQEETDVIVQEELDF